MAICGATNIVRHGIIEVAADGRVVKMNSAAKQLVCARDGLRLQDHSIRAALPAHDEELQSSISKAIGTQGMRTGDDSYLVCGRLSGKRPYIVHVIPLDPDADPHPAHAAIVVVDPERELKPPKALLRKLFGLTDAETEVALRMLSGDAMQLIAKKSAVSVTTVRTHVQRIFHKTDTHRQADLVRLLVSLVP